MEKIRRLPGFFERSTTSAARRVRRTLLPALQKLASAGRSVARMRTGAASGNLPPSFAKDFSVDLKNHRLQYYAGGSTLVISFDSAAAVQSPYEGRLPWGSKFFRGEGFSLLGVIARRSDWYRDNSVPDALEALRERGFFDSFDKILLTGCSMGGFAATVFAPIIPGCIVLALCPQSTLIPDVVPWDKRYPNARKEDWSLPYSDAVSSLRNVARAYIVFDPYLVPDRRHAERYERYDNIHLLHLPFADHGVPVVLQQAGILKSMTLEALSGALDPHSFGRLSRSRKTSVLYCRTLAQQALKRGHLRHARAVCNHAQPIWPQQGFIELKSLSMAAEGRMPEAIRLLNTRLKKSD